MSALAVPDSGEWASLDRTLDRYLRHVSIERGLSGNTVAAYRRDLTGYLRFLAARAVTVPDGIRKPDLAAFATALRSRPEGGLAASSLARTLSSVRGFHRFLLDEGLVDADVAADMKPPKIPSRLPKAITIEQMSELLAAADGEDIRSLRDRALLELLYATGARVSEAVALDVDDVRAVDDADFGDGTGGDGTGGPDGGTVDTVRLTGKGGKTRIVPLGHYARAAIDAYLVRGRPELATRGAGTPALFLGLRGGRLSRQNVWLIVQARAQRAHLGMDISPHTFRHSFATHLLEGGADVRVVQELLGHSSVATTQIYTLVTADTLRDMYTTAHPRAR
jgi:integrase/recombinase XerD